MSAGPWRTLVDADGLAGALGAPGLVVLDCRASLADPGAGVRAHAAAHVPGAVHADLERDLSGRPSPGAGRHPWPQAESFARRLGTWGIAPGSQVVAYDDGDGAFAARAWWLLRSFGHVTVAILDGGWARWTALGLPMRGGGEDSGPAPVYPGRFDATRLLDADAARRHVASGGLLVDARAPGRFRGEVEPIDRVAGHVPGAVNRPYAANLADGRWKPAEALAGEFEALLAGRPPEALVAMCGSGVTACHHLLAMAHAGLPGAGLYCGSWSGWIEDPERSVATGDS